MSKTNAAYKTGSTGVGQYTMPNLPVGSYELAFEAEGFKKLIRSNVPVNATEVVYASTRFSRSGRSRSPSKSRQRFRVYRRNRRRSAPAYRLANWWSCRFRSATHASPRISRTRFSPGVSGDSYNSHVNGSTSFSKETLLDGASVSTFRAGDFGQLSTSIEALQELKVQTSGMSAEFGRTQAGVFNFVMKSGTNQLHGSVYGALRNEAFNANTFGNNARGLVRGLDRKQNFAGSFGGPVEIPKLYNGGTKRFSMLPTSAIASASAVSRRLIAQCPAAGILRRRF